MDPRPPFVTSTRLAGPGRRPGAIVILAACLIGLAILKPWPSGGGPTPIALSRGIVVPADGSASGGPTPRADAASANEASPSPTPSLLPGELACQPAGWRLAWTGRMAIWNVDTRLVVDPVPASGPLDPAIPLANLGHDAISGIGACAPPLTADGAGVAGTIHAVWRVATAGSTVAQPIATTLLRGSAVVRASPGARIPASPSSVLDLIRPTADPSGIWPTGRYVLEIDAPVPGENPTAGPATFWLGIAIDAPAP